MKKRMRKLLSLIAALTVMATSLTGCGEPKTYEVTLEMGENYVFDATQIFDVDEKEAAKYEANLSTLDTKKAGVYEVAVTKGNKEYTVIYTVEDTKAPEVKLTKKHVFTKDVNLTDFDSFADTKDASEVKETLVKFEKIDDLRAYNDEDIAEFTKDIVNTSDTETLLNRVDAYAGEEGVYKAVYVAEDAYGHKTAREVIVIFDTTAPTFDGMEDIPETVEVKDLEAEWKENYVSKLGVTDNADGVIADESLEVSMELTDAENHTYTVKVGYTDRAGNKASTEYFFSLKEKKAEKPATQATDTEASTSGGVTEPQASAPSGDGTVTYNGFVFRADLHPDALAYSQALANAGYYNPIAWSNGMYYMIVPAGEWDAGAEYFDSWLSSQGLTYTSMGGGNFDMYAIAEELSVAPIPIQ